MYLLQPVCIILILCRENIYNEFKLVHTNSCFRLKFGRATFPNKGSFISFFASVCSFRWVGKVEKRPPKGCVDPKRAAGSSRGQAECSCSGVLPWSQSLPAGCRGWFIKSSTLHKGHKGTSAAQYLHAFCKIFKCRWRCTSCAFMLDIGSFIVSNCGWIDPLHAHLRAPSKRLFPWRPNTSWLPAVLSSSPRMQHRMKLPGSWQPWQRLKLSWTRCDL